VRVGDLATSTLDEPLPLRVVKMTDAQIHSSKSNVAHAIASYCVAAVFAGMGGSNTSPVMGGKTIAGVRTALTLDSCAWIMKTGKGIKAKRT